MRRIIYILAVFVLAACTKEQEAVTDVSKSDKTVLQTHAFQIPLETAIDNLWSLMDHMEGAPQTRTSRDRKIRGVDFITIGAEATRSSDFELPDTLLYIVKFGKGTDYAILSADTRVPPVIGIAEKEAGDGLLIDRPPKRRPTPPAITFPDDYLQTIDEGENLCYDEADDEIDPDNWDTDDNPAETDEELFQFITDFATGYAIDEIIKVQFEAATRAMPDWDWNGKTWVTTERVNPHALTI